MPPKKAHLHLEATTEAAACQVNQRLQIFLLLLTQGNVGGTIRIVERLDSSRCLSLGKEICQSGPQNFDVQKLTMSVPMRFLTLSELSVASD